MADIKKALSKLIDLYVPELFKSEMRQKEIEGWLRNTLLGHKAYGEEERKTVEASRVASQKEAITNAILGYFKGRNVPEKSSLSFLREIGLLAPEIKLPSTSTDEIEKAISAAARGEMFRMSGEPMPLDLIEVLQRYQGPEAVAGYGESIVKQMEAAKERPLREREIKVQEEALPVRRGELAAKLGEAAQPEGKKELADLEKERRTYNRMLETKMDEKGELLGGEQINLIKANIREISGKEKRIIKNNAALRKEYEEVAESLKQKGYRPEHLNTNVTLINWLIDNGYNVEVMKDIFR